MKSILIGALLPAFGGFFLGVHHLYRIDPAAADFVLKCALSLGTFSAVLLALYGDYIREKLDPIEVKIEVSNASNTVVDNALIDGVVWNVYCHHLVVVNLTPHKPIKDCRVWLKKILVKQLDNQWSEEDLKFAVPRLMEWAPSEYSPDKRTFCKQQVFDLGRTFGNNRGFEATYWREQGGAVPRLFQVGKKVRFFFFVTADM